MIFVCGFDEADEPWRLSRSVWPEEAPTVKVRVDCCNRNAPIFDTETRQLVSYGGYVVDRVFRCHPSAGCRVNPGYLRTAHLRYFE